MQACGRAQVSRQLPLPGGYQVWDVVYFAGTNQVFKGGDTVWHGEKGEVRGPATRSIETQGVARSRSLSADAAEAFGSAAGMACRPPSLTTAPRLPPWTSGAWTTCERSGRAYAPWSAA